MQRGFTLIELIIVIGIIALLAAAVFVSVDPAKRLGDTKDSVRASDAIAIEKAIQKTIADNGVIPASLELVENVPYMLVTDGGVHTGTAECNTLDLDINRTDIAQDISDHLQTLPVDSDSSGDDTGYYVIRRNNSYFCEPCNEYEDTFSDAGYLYARSVTIQNGQVSGSTNLTSFPMLFSGTYSYLATTGNGGNVTDDNGYDIIFSSDQAGFIKLDHEIDSYSSTTGEIEVWVEVPTVDHNDDTVVYIHYGNSNISSSQENVSGVWNSNYQAVWHLGDSAVTASDSTSNSNDLTTVDMTASDLVDGHIASAVELDSSSHSQYLYRTDANLTGAIPSKSSGGASDFTISAWIDLVDNIWRRPLVSKQGDYGGNIRGFVASPSYDVVGGELEVYKNDTDKTHLIASQQASTNWTYVNFVYDYLTDGTSQMKIYFDDTVDANSTSTAVGPPQANSRDLNVGIYDYDASFRWYFGGIIDELRISSDAKDEHWIATEYNNQNTPASFYVISSEL